METETTQSAVEVVDRLLEAAHGRGASDLHIDPMEDGVEVRVRSDGALAPLEALPEELGTSLVGRLKALANLLVYRTDIPQEGRIPRDRSVTGCEVRVATYPSLYGERVALRFDTPEGVPQSLASLGFRGAVLLGLVQAIEQPDGLILLTGPSGSGKTTTLYSCLQHLTAAQRPRSIMTIEDPVERRVRGITQTEINPHAGLTFERALRSILRQDPEVVLVGEVRDRETAQIALEAGLTGHLVASTIHAGTAPAVFARLLEMGLEPFVLTTAVRVVLAQRLLRQVCGSCGGEGCEQCAGTGFRGRFVVAELVPMSGPLREVILNRGDGEALARAAVEAGSRTLREEADLLVAEGVTTREEVDRVLGLG